MHSYKIVVVLLNVQGGIIIHPANLFFHKIDLRDNIDPRAQYWYDENVSDYEGWIDARLVFFWIILNYDNLLLTAHEVFHVDWGEKRQVFKRCIRDFR